MSPGTFGDVTFGDVDGFHVRCMAHLINPGVRECMAHLQEKMRAVKKHATRMRPLFKRRDPFEIVKKDLNIIFN